MLREIPSTNRPAFTFLLSICVLHLVIRLYLINQQGFFYDETTTWSYSRSPESLILAMVSDIHPPLYFALMGVWTKLFGTSEIAFRLPSVLGSFLTMITLMVFARELDQRRNLVLPILVGALYVCLPYDIHLSKTARSWTMAVFLCGLFSYLYACVTLRDKKNWFVGSLIVAISRGFCTLYHPHIRGSRGDCRNPNSTDESQLALCGKDAGDYLYFSPSLPFVGFSLPTHS